MKYKDILLTAKAPMGLILFIALLLSLACVSAVNAEDFTPEQLAGRLQQTYEKTSSFAADFKQSTTLAMNQRTRKGEGKLLIKKPGRMRWDYLAPDKQVLLCDGEKMYMYFEKAAQLMVTDAKAYLQSDVTYSFFTGSGDILRDFEAAKLDVDSGEENYTLKLTPKQNHPQVDFINIWLRDDFLIKRLQIIDHFGSVTDITFTNLQINKDLPDDLFSFTPPDGTEIIEQ